MKIGGSDAVVMVERMYSSLLHGKSAGFESIPSICEGGINDKEENETAGAW
jgi:hypothetical protein